MNSQPSKLQKSSARRELDVAAHPELLKFAGLLLACLVLFMLPQRSRGDDWTSRLVQDRSHDFGTVARGAEAVHFFEISNPLNRPIRIASVRSSCGCTRVQVMDRVIAPGAKGRLKAQFNTRSFIGQKEATITVLFNQPTTAELQLRVKGRIRGDIVLDPALIDFKQTAVGRSKSVSTVIHYAGDMNWKILDVQSHCPYLKAELKEIERRQNSIKYRLTTHLAEKTPTGRLQGDVIIVTNDAKSRKVALPFSANVVSPLRVSPKSVRFQNLVEAGKVQKARVIFSASAPFRITGARCQDKRISVKFPSTTKKTQLAVVSLEAETEPSERLSSARVRPSRPKPIQIEFETDIGERVSIDVILD